MTVKISMEVTPEVIKRMEKLSDARLAALCDDEVAKRVHYLETVLEGWKTYKKVKEEHRRLLFLMLILENKDPLHDYERLVLYPKVADKKHEESRAKVKPESKKTDVASSPSIVQLGADCSESSNEESGSLSSGDDYQQLPKENNEKDIPTIILVKKEVPVFKKPLPPQKNDKILKQNKKQSSTTSVSQKEENRVPTPSLGAIEAVESQEDKSVVGAPGNSMLSENIALAAQKVRMALDNVELLQSANHNDSKANITKMNLLKLESKLIQSVSEVSKEESRTIMSVSKGIKKRQKKAAKKAADAAEVQRKIIERKKEADRQSRLAAEALISLSTSLPKTNVVPAISPLPIVATLPIKPSEDELPLSAEELKLFMEITKSGKSEFIPGSEEDKLMKKYEVNRDVLEEYLKKSCNFEQKYNAQMLQQIRQLTDEIQGISAPQTLTKEEELAKAIEYIESKLNGWKKSTAPQAQHFVEMYQYFIENMNSGIANVICGYLPYEYLPNAEFEQTMLMQYQSGRMFEKKSKKSDKQNALC